MELDQALRNQFVVAMQQKLDISQIHAEINLATAKHLGKDRERHSSHGVLRIVLLLLVKSYGICCMINMN